MHHCPSHSGAACCLSTTTLILLPRPMPLRKLPLEITDLVLDELGAGPPNECLANLLACCTATKAFVKQCQKHIFHSVTLFSAHIESHQVSEEAEEARRQVQRRSLLFARTIARRPHLRPYVREVTFVLISAIMNDIPPEVAEVFHQLPCVVSLEFHCTINSPELPPTRITDTLAQHIASAASSLPLKTFISNGIENLRLHLEDLPSSIEELYLARTSLDVTWFAARR